MIMHGTGVEGLDDAERRRSECRRGQDSVSCASTQIPTIMAICSVDVGERRADSDRHRRAERARRRCWCRSAKVGAVLPGGVKIKKGKLRGVESDGMCCSGPEIGVPDDLYPSRRR